MIREEFDFKRGVSYDEGGGIWRSPWPLMRGTAVYLCQNINQQDMPDRS
jgi:hypothetical protein